MARRKRPKKPAAQRKTDTTALSNLLNTPEGVWRAARMLAAEVFWTFAPAIKTLMPRFFEGDKARMHGLPTMAVDKHYRCYVNNDFTMELVKKAEAVSPSNPCPTCGATSHHKLSYVAGVICHEAQHPLRTHGQRALDLEARPMLWNVAADCEINDDLLEIFQTAWEDARSKSASRPRLCFPEDVILPRYFREQPDFKGLGLRAGVDFPDDLLAESYYYRLLDLKDLWEQEKQKNENDEEEEDKQDGDEGQNEDSGNGGGGEDEANESGGDEDSDEDGDGDTGDGSGDGDEGEDDGDGDGESQKNGPNGQPSPDVQGKHKAPGDGPPNGGGGGEMTPDDLFNNLGNNCGSGAHGQVGDFEDGVPSADNPGISEAENKQIQREVAKEIRKASATRGNIPAGMKLWADEILEPPKVDWRKQFQHLVRQAVARAFGADHRTWRRMGRASASTGYKYLYPATYTPVPKVGVVLDTSGSMGGGEGSPLYDAFIEVEGICKALGADLTFVSVDAAAGEIQEIRSFREALLSGGGGTDMRVGVEALEKAKQPIQVCVVLTDGYTPWPEHRSKKFEIIAALVGGDGAADQVPPFIKTVIIEDEE